MGFRVWGSSGYKVVGFRVFIPRFYTASILGGSRVVMNGVISPLIWVIIAVTLPKNPTYSDQT